MIRRSSHPVVALLAAAAILAASGWLAHAPSTSAATTPFTDIAGTTFQADIEWLWTEGITKGCTATLYCPERIVTRGEMASFLARMFDLPVTTTDFFTDDDGTTHEIEINRLAASGITTGCTATTFCPTQPVSRGQMASFLTRAIPLTDGAGNDYFRDDNDTTHEADIDRAAAAGITTGCGTWRYCPTEPVSRGQMAGYLHRVEKPITPPPYPAGGGVTLFVAVSGADANNTCTVESQPCRTIGHALTETLEGDDILVGPGTFAEEGLSVDQDILIRGDPSGDTTIDGSGGEKLRIMTIATGRAVELRHLTITGGWSATNGGGIESAGTLTIRHSTIRNNHAQGSGGGVASTGTLTIEDSRIRWNSTTFGSGGGAYTNGITVRRATFAGNTSGQNGGAIENVSLAMRVSRSTFVRNGAGTTGNGWGGALENVAEAASSIANTTIADNTANGNGGGISTVRGDLLIANTTISGNSGWKGGGIFYFDDPAFGATLELENVLVAGNIASQDVSAAPSSVTASIIGIPVGLTIGALLDPDGVQDNGGPTQTIALTDSTRNPAIGKGDSLTCASAPVDGIDQRGRPRDTKCDIGAYEIQP